MSPYTMTHEKKEGPGYIYVFWNRQWTSGPLRRWPWSKYYKVGETRRTPEERIRDYRTYSPFQTEILFAVPVSKRLLAEKTIHEILRRWNMDFGGGKEFFKRRLGRIVDVVKKVTADVDRGKIVRRGRFIIWNGDVIKQSP